MQVRPPSTVTRVRPPDAKDPDWTPHPTNSEKISKVLIVLMRPTIGTDAPSNNLASPLALVFWRSLVACLCRTIHFLTKTIYCRFQCVFVRTPTAISKAELIKEVLKCYIQNMSWEPCHFDEKTNESLRFFTWFWEHAPQRHEWLSLSSSRSRRHGHTSWIRSSVPRCCSGQHEKAFRTAAPAAAVFAQRP